MSYLEQNVMSSKEVVKIKPQTNSIFLVLAWIWGILGCWLIFIPTVKAIIKTVKFCSTEYLITDKNAMEKYGWISTHTDEMPLEKIENIVVNYTFWGKVFNYGNICLQGTNRNNINFTQIKDAESIKKQINDLL